MDEIRIQLITYNVGTWAPVAGKTDISAILPSAGPTPDFVFVGFQEVNTSPTALVSDTVLSPTGEDEWTSHTRQALAQKGLIKIRSIRLLGIVLSMFCLEKHIPHLRGIETQYTRLGLNGYWGNKGAVSVRYQVYGVSVCVLNSHLIPHDHQNEMRLLNYDTVLSGHTYSEASTQSIMYHDYVFWMGDLNFRLEENTFNFEEISMKLEKGEFSDLLAVDQLNTARKEGTAFSHLDETLPTFAPTYKFKMGTDVYDAKRRPAWTDRILYKVNTGNYDKVDLQLHQDTYTSHPIFLESDHKPVSSNFRIDVFTSQDAQKLLLPAFDPIVKFHIDELYLDEDNVIVYTVNTKHMRHLSSWDWVGVYRCDVHSLENHLAFQYAPSKPVRDNTFELFIDDAVFIRYGEYRLVYFSSGATHIYGISPPILARARDLAPEVAVEVTEEL